MPNKRSNLRQSIHVQLNDFWRHFALHIHVDTSNSMHRHIHDQHDLRHMFTEG